MICVLQFAALIYGIVVLVTGKFSLTRGSEVTGTRARIIGGILACWLPLSAVIGFTIGILLVMNNPNMNQQGIMREMTQYWWVDLAVAAFVIITVLIIANTAKKTPSQPFGQVNSPYPPQQQFPPKSDSDNPYQPPFGS